MLRKLGFGLTAVAMMAPGVAAALGVGDYQLHSYLNQPLDMDVSLHEKRDVQTLLYQLQQVTADGFQVLSAREVPLKAPSLMSSISKLDYIIFTDLPQNIMHDAFEFFFYLFNNILKYEYFNHK